MARLAEELRNGNPKFLEAIKTRKMGLRGPLEWQACTFSLQLCKIALGPQHLRAGGGIALEDLSPDLPLSA